MKFSNNHISLALLMLSIGAASAGKVRSLEQKEETNSLRKLKPGKGRGKGGKGGKRPKCGKGKGKGAQCPEGYVKVSYDIEFDKDFDRLTDAVSPYIRFFEIDNQNGDLYSVSDDLFQAELCGDIGCVPEEGTYELNVQDDENA